MQRLKDGEGELMPNLLTIYTAASVVVMGTLSWRTLSRITAGLGWRFSRTAKLRRRSSGGFTVGSYAMQSASAGQEGLKDVSSGLSATFEKA